MRSLYLWTKLTFAHIAFNRIYSFYVFKALLLPDLHLHWFSLIFISILLPYIPAIGLTCSVIWMQKVLSRIIHHPPQNFLYNFSSSRRIECRHFTNTYGPYSTVSQRYINLVWRIIYINSFLPTAYPRRGQATHNTSLARVKAESAILVEGMPLRHSFALISHIIINWSIYFLAFYFSIINIK